MKYFLYFWTLALSAIPLSFFFLFSQHWLLSFIFAAVVCSSRLERVRIMIRAGARGHAPLACDSELLLTKFKGKNPTIVGRAWGYFLQRKTATATVLSMYNFTGRREDGWWAAGTTIETVTRYYKKHALTFPSHPSYDDITIGSWFSSGCHGSGGNAGKASSSVLQCVEVVCFDPPSVRQIKSYEQLRQIFDRKGHNCVITWIQFYRLWSNDLVQKSAFDVNSLEGALKWLSDGAILRVLFVGAARDALGIRWQEIYDDTAHVDPHCCSKCCTFVQADCCSACCGWHEIYSRWNGITTLREANKWCPTIWPIEMFVAVVGGYKNYEIIFRVDEMTPTLLLEMATQLREMHREIGGRTEIRFGTGVVFWDVSLQHHFVRPFLLLKTFGVSRIALHLSKYNPGINIMPIVPVGDIYFNKNTGLRW